MTYFEKIKAMSVEEMAEFLKRSTTCKFCIYHHEVCHRYGYSPCGDGIKKYLESEVEE